MKFERTVMVRTPDGRDHPSVAAAEKHMFGLNFAVLGAATAEEIEAATNQRATTEPQLQNIRAALRDVALAAWPRASKGRVKTKPAPAPAPETERMEVEDETPPPAPTSKRKR